MSIMTELFVSSCSCCDIQHTLDCTGEWSQFNMPYFPLVGFHITTSYTERGVAST